MKIIKGRETNGYIDELEGLIHIRNRTVELPPNIVLSAGDTITIKGESYDVLDYNPSWFPDVAKRGAQIIQSKDASYIISRTGIRCGSQVLESGIGSGGLSSALLWAIGREGTLYSYEVDEAAIGTGQDNVRKFQDNGSWKVTHGDVRTSELPENIDCAILDIPDPWNAVIPVLGALRPGGYICTYSPTFNQAETTVGALNAAGASVIETVELIRRNILVRPDATRPDHQMLGHTAFITLAAKRSGHAVQL